MCSEKSIVNNRPHPLMSPGVPAGPFPQQKRYTKAELVKLPSHERKPRDPIHGPMESARQGTGRWVSIAIFSASPRSSSQLFMRNDTPVRGQITEKRDKYPRDN